MKKWKKILITVLFITVFIFSIIFNIPAWVVGSLISHYSQGRAGTMRESGTFWNGEALLYAADHDTKTTVPLVRISWHIKFGISKFIDIEFKTSNKTIARVALNKKGVIINDVNLRLSLDQLTPLLGNLNSLGLSGNVHVSAASLLLSKINQGSISVGLEDVASAIAPVNPIGTYNVVFNLADSSFDISSNANSVINVTGTGNLNSLVLNSKIQPDKKSQLLQFMTMMGVPQADGSYQMKVF